MNRYPLPPRPDPVAINWEHVHRVEREEEGRKKRLKMLFEKPNPFDRVAQFGSTLLGLPPMKDADAGLEPMRPDDPLLAAAALAQADQQQVKKLLGENPSSVRKDLVAAAALHDQNTDEPYFGLQKVSPIAAEQNPPRSYAWSEVPRAMLDNAAGDAGEIASGLWQAVTNPLETAKTIGKIGIGTAQLLTPEREEYETQYARPHLKQMVADYGLVRGVDGEWHFDQEQLKRTLAERPLQSMLDASAVLGGGAAIPGRVSRIAATTRKIAKKPEAAPSIMHAAEGAVGAAGQTVPGVRYVRGPTSGFIYEVRDESARPAAHAAGELVSPAVDIRSSARNMTSGADVTGGLAPHAIVEAPSGVVQTVRNPLRISWPGIYGDPRDIVGWAARQAIPEDLSLKQLFGVTRDDLYEIGERGTRKGNIEPFFNATAGRSRQAEQIMTPENAERIKNVLYEAERYPELIQGVDSFYVMDPAYWHLVKLVGDDEAKRLYKNLNAYMGMASSGSTVLTEINRGTAANYLANRGRFEDFVRYGGLKPGERPPDFPQDLSTLQWHRYHPYAHVRPMQKFVETGDVNMTSTKVPLYIWAGGVPETGFQTRWAVPDMHFTRSLGVPDIRTGSDVARRNAAMSPSLYTPIGPWYREAVAEPLGLEATSAQARQWGVFGPVTGLQTPIGVPKLELLARRIASEARRRGIDPYRLRDEVLQGKNLASVIPPALLLADEWYSGDDDDR